MILAVFLCIICWWIKKNQGKRPVMKVFHLIAIGLIKRIEWWRRLCFFKVLYSFGGTFLVLKRGVVDKSIYKRTTMVVILLWLKIYVILSAVKGVQWWPLLPACHNLCQHQHVLSHFILALVGPFGGSLDHEPPFFGYAQLNSVCGSCWVWGPFTISR